MKIVKVIAYIYNYCFLNYKTIATYISVFAGGKSGGRTVAIGASVGVGALLVFLFLVLFYCRRSRRRSEWIYAGAYFGDTSL